MITQIFMKEGDWMATLPARDELMRLVAQNLNVDLFQLKVVVKLLFGCSVTQENNTTSPRKCYPRPLWCVVARIIIPSDRDFMARHCSSFHGAYEFWRPLSRCLMAPMPLIDFRHGKHQNRENQDDDGSTQGVSHWKFVLIVGAYTYHKYRYLIIVSRLFYD